VTPAILRQLLQIAEVRKSRDLAALEALVAADRACEAEIEELSDTHARDWADGAAALTPLFQQGLRLVWADARIAEVRKRREVLADRIAGAREAAIQSLGKHEALEQMIKEVEREAKHLRATRAERDAPPAAPPALE
jgi:hypothetical protein